MTWQVFVEPGDVAVMVRHWVVIKWRGRHLASRWGVSVLRGVVEWAGGLPVPSFVCSSRSLAFGTPPSLPPFSSQLFHRIYAALAVLSSVTWQLRRALVGVAVKMGGQWFKNAWAFRKWGVARVRMGGGLRIDMGQGFRHVSSALLGLVNPGDMALSG